MAFVTGTALLLVSIGATSPAFAESRYTIRGSFLVASLEDPSNGTFTQPNPEGNFDKGCARGVNGADSRLRVGAKVRVIDGNNRVIKSGKILEGYWNTPGSTRGRCGYLFEAVRVPRANFMCVTVFGDVVSQTTPLDANKRNLIVDYYTSSYYGPNWPVIDPEKEAANRLYRSQCVHP